MWSKKYKGFTIVEMLVVVAIIAILATVMTISIGNSVVKSRDSKRMADIAMVNKAIGLYAAEKRQFPQEDPCAGVTGSSGNCVYDWEIIQGDETTGSVDKGSGNWESSGNAFKNALKTYLPSLPKDPLNSSRKDSNAQDIFYSYMYYSDQSVYYLRARLELDNDAGNFGSTNLCYGFLGSKSSEVAQASWGSMPGPDNNCNSSPAD